MGEVVWRGLLTFEQWQALADEQQQFYLALWQHQRTERLKRLEALREVLYAERPKPSANEDAAHRPLWTAENIGALLLAERELI